MKFNKLDVMIIIPFLIPLTLMENYKFFYIPFLIILIKNIYLCFKKSMNIEELLITGTIYSILVSDNFVIIGFTGLLVLYYLGQVILRKRQFDLRDKNFLIITAIITIYFIFNVVINRVHVANIILFFMYNSVFIAIPLMFKVMDIRCFKCIDEAVNTSILSQIVAVILVVILNFGVVLSNLFGDWSIGTLGVSQGVQLFNLFIFGAIKFFAYFNKTKEKKYFFAFSLSVLFALTTVTLANTVLFFAALGFFVVVFISSPKFKVLFLTMIIVMAATFWFTSHPWVRDQLKEITFNSQYRNERIKKLQAYEDTFINMPKKSIKAGILGVGASNYSSRGALTASGYYTSWYTKDRFPTYTSDFARKYIRPRIYQRLGLSIVDQPANQYVSIMGEGGYLGFLLFIGCLIFMFIRSNRFNKLTLIYFAFILSLDNYFEYPKIALLFWITWFLIQNLNDNKVRFVINNN